MKVEYVLKSENEEGGIITFSKGNVLYLSRDEYLELLKWKTES